MSILLILQIIYISFKIDGNNIKTVKVETGDEYFNMTLCNWFLIIFEHRIKF